MPMLAHGIWTVFWISSTVYQAQMTCWGRKADKVRMWNIKLINLSPCYINIKMCGKSSGVTVSSHCPLSQCYSFMAKGFLPADPFYFFQWTCEFHIIALGYCWIPPRLDPSKLNSGQFIELAVSEEAVMLYEFFTSSFCCLVCYISLHSAVLLLNILSPYLQHVACLTPTHPTSACTSKALQYV